MAATLQRGHGTDVSIFAPLARANAQNRLHDQRCAQQLSVECGPHHERTSGLEVWHWLTVGLLATCSPSSRWRSPGSHQAGSGARRSRWCPRTKLRSGRTPTSMSKAAWTTHTSDE
eukprot:2141060-Amphidinium_carterae.1